MPPVDDVYTHLLDEGLAGGISGWDLYRRRLSDDGDRVVVVSEDGGPLVEVATASGIGDGALTDKAVLVTVRADAWDSDAAKAKADAIFAALHGVLHSTIGATAYLRVRAQTPEPIFAGFDEQHRPLFTTSFLLLAEAAVA